MARFLALLALAASAVAAVTSLQDNHTKKSSSTTSTTESTSSTSSTPSTTSTSPATSPSTGLGPSSYAPTGAFPVSLYSSYYNDPTATTAQPQPVISDPVTHVVYPLNLTDPNNIPGNDTWEAHPLPPVASGNVLYNEVYNQILSIATSPIYTNNSCGQCQAGLNAAKLLALAAPDQIPTLAVNLCTHFSFSKTCYNQYSNLALGGVLAQVLQNANTSGLDGHMLCQNFLGRCTLPEPVDLDLDSWFSSPKPNPLPTPKTPSGVLLKVLHISDIHLDARYATGSEANCSSSLCCRSNNFNKNSPSSVLEPAPQFGVFTCDSPLSLVEKALSVIPTLAGTEETGFAWSIFTGDLVAHDPENELSQSYTEYVETVIYDLFKRLLGSGPMYATLGNHDSYNSAQDAPFGTGIAGEYSWNYEHVSSLWQQDGWINSTTAEFASTHYAAYMTMAPVPGLRIISLNTNLWYKANYFNYINMTNPDTSGLLRFLTDQLDAAEKAGDRAWVMGHVLSGWDGTGPLLNPSNLFYQIIDRYSPHVVANIFFGHVHEDELSIFYSNNGTVQSASTAQTLSWMGPSITPLTNLNSGFRVYEIDSATFEVIEAHTWKSEVASYPSLDGQVEFGPTFEYEYNTRQTYGNNITWGATDPLNATWWHLVTEQMEADSSLVQTFHQLQGKGSPLIPACSDQCVQAKICYIRSGSAPIALSNCIPGFGSVQ